MSLLIFNKKESMAQFFATRTNNVPTPYDWFSKRNSLADDNICANEIRQANMFITLAWFARFLAIVSCKQFHYQILDSLHPSFIPIQSLAETVMSVGLGSVLLRFASAVPRFTYSFCRCFISGM